VLNSLDIKYKKAKKVATVAFATINFETEAEKEEAKAKLAVHEIKGQVLVVENQKKRSREGFQANNAKKAKTATPETANEAVAPLFGTPYEKQLENKNNEVKQVNRQLVLRIRKDDRDNQAPSEREKDDLPFLGIKESPVRDRYRNKAEFTYGTDKDGKPCIGFLLGRFEDGVTTVADPTDCVTVSAHMVAIRNVAQEHLSASKLAVYAKQTHTGFWRLLQVRAFTSGEAMVIVQINPTGMTKDQLDAEKKSLISVFTAARKQGLLLASLQWQAYDGVSNAAPIDTPVEVLFGESSIHETLCGLKFRVSPNAFFQTNSGAAEVLYSSIKEWCNASSKSTVLDICSGTGTIGQIIAKAEGVNKVIGIELSESAVADANENARLNGITNVSYIAGKVENHLQKVLSTLTTDDGEIIGIVDPPRDGLHPSVIKSIRHCKKMTKLIYVACDVTNGLMKNIGPLCKPASNTYPGPPFKPVKTMAIDMFPHCPAFEYVMLLDREEWETDETSVESDK